MRAEPGYFARTNTGLFRMKLPREFCRLPVCFDTERLRAEALSLPATAWHQHPLGYPGNSAARLISGDGCENDDLGGTMGATPHLQASPYIRQVLASFGVTWSRSRLMRLGPHSQVPQHCDINYHWYYRVRIHIPIVTYPEVRFLCGRESVHMQAGEAWLFDNWRPHKVVNQSPYNRIHLVADTVGNAAFWRLAQQGQWSQFDNITVPASLLDYRPDVDAPIKAERFNVPPVMPPSELEVLLGDLVSDLVHMDTDERIARDEIARFSNAIGGFLRDWRELWCLYADTQAGRPHYIRRRDEVRAELNACGQRISMRSNQLSALQVADARVLKHAVNIPGAEAYRKPESGHIQAPAS